MVQFRGRCRVGKCLEGAMFFDWIWNRQECCCRLIVIYSLQHEIRNASYDRNRGTASKDIGFIILDQLVVRVDRRRLMTRIGRESEIMPHAAMLLSQVRVCMDFDGSNSKSTKPTTTIQDCHFSANPLSSIFFCNRDRLLQLEQIASIIAPA